MSTQVLGEFYVTVTRKLAMPLPPAEAARAVDSFCRFRVQAVTPELVRSAIRRSQASRLSFWDSLIVETAQEAGSALLFTEDLQDGQRIDGLQVVDPFRSAEGE